MDAVSAALSLSALGGGEEMAVNANNGNPSMLATAASQVVPIGKESTPSQSKPTSIEKDLESKDNSKAESVSSKDEDEPSTKRYIPDHKVCSNWWFTVTVKESVPNAIRDCQPRRKLNRALLTINT